MRWFPPGTAQHQTPSRRRQKPVVTTSLPCWWVAKRAATVYQEGIALDVNGYISEGAGENLFEVKDGVLFTPPFTSSALPGITRDAIIKLAKELGIEVREQVLSRESLYLADEVFMSGTAAEITPVRSVDGIQVGEGRCGPVTKRIQQAFFGLFHWRNRR
ncbi:branched-chain amino-acid aminotransferase [Escherichia coli]|uniref:Aminodeoxychorismate lyase n=1 Tax=Escherichia coli TaxID=562 RepID=A0A377B5M4_ECOLX|nr:branched-chain amino-acid aminotransferase [Escherichia coli]